MSTKFFTNSEENTLINKFEGVFTYNSLKILLKKNTRQSLHS